MKSILNYFLNKEWILNIVMCFLSEETKERIYIAKFRAELEMFGYLTKDMTDKQVKEGLSVMAKIVSQMGITAVQASKAGELLRKVILKTHTDNFSTKESV